jgi:uncharacterized protein with NAD-binding domain and iron-sulfur cluster
MRQEYYDNIKKIIDSTKRGKVEWIKQNPTTLYFTRNNDSRKTYVNIQKVSEYIQGDYYNEYIFTITDSTGQELIKLSENKFGVVIGDEYADSELFALLSDLYESAEDSIIQKEIDLFNDLVKDL